ncbi:MAG: DMT family transporter [Desulfurococcaceae archaeon]
MRVDWQLLLYIVVIWIAISSASILVLLSGAVAEACAFWRLLLSSLLILLLKYIRSRGNNRGVPRIQVHHAISGIMLALHFILWMKSLFMIKVYVSTLLVTLYPMYALVIDALIYKHKLSKFQVTGVVMITLLVALYLDVHELVLETGVFYALLAGVLCAVYFEIGSYARSRLRENALDYAFSTYLVASFFVWLYSTITGSNLYIYSISTYAYFLLLALVPMILGHTLMNYLLGKYPASLVTLISYGEPFGAGLLAFIILGQSVAPSQVLFGIVIISLIILISTYQGHTKGLR